MKKIFIILTFLLFIPSLNASTVYDFEFTKDDIYDYANVFGENEYERISDKIKEFELKSSIDLNVITVNSRDEYLEIERRLLEDEVTNDKSIYIPTVVVIYGTETNMKIISNNHYNHVWDRKNLQKFEVYKLNPYKNIFIYDTEIDLMIKDWIDYYDKDNQINIVLIITVSLLVTLIIVKEITKKYRVRLINEADKYISENKIIVK